MPNQLKVAITVVSQKEEFEVSAWALLCDNGFGLGMLADFEVVAVAAPRCTPERVYSWLIESDVQSGV
ncbi:MULTISPECIES: hypothetical protein [Pseudomonas]|uniref:hypothetical protein n=1 Tax=Pseudomonas TaxID=286 RepID=UPI000DA9E03B|nr:MULTISPECIES: hypothetical protein [Pseudomonas]MDW3713399.1 hypothetical protein [Pseudomonas sp. 2023EL-01195]